MTSTITDFFKSLFNAIKKFLTDLFNKSEETETPRQKRKISFYPRSSTRKLNRFFKQNGSSGDDSKSSTTIGTPVPESKAELLEEELIHQGIIKPEDFIADDPKRRHLQKRLIKTPKGKKFLARITRALAIKEASKKAKLKSTQKKKEKVNLKKIMKIIQAAMAKLNITLSSKDQQKVAKFYRDNLHFANTHTNAAIIALLGVISVHLTGTIQPILQVNWGNYFGVVDYNPYHGFDAGGAPIDQADRIDYSKGDPLGLEAEAIETAMENVGFYNEFNNFLKENGFVVDKQNKTITLQNHGQALSL